MNNEIYNWWSGCYVWEGENKIPALEYYKDKPIDYENSIKIVNNEAICYSSLWFNPYVNYEEYLDSKGYIVTGHLPYTGYCIFQLKQK